MTAREELDREIERLGYFIRAAEDWTDTYHKDRDSFDKLLRAERKLDTIMRHYFEQLSPKVEKAVDWSRYNGHLMAADYEVKVDIDWEGQREDIFALMIGDMNGVGMLGATAAEAIYQRGLIINDMTEAIRSYAETQTLTLSKSVTDTTIDRVRRLLSQGIQDGSDQSEMREILRAYINNPVRADIVARTETVNAFGGGQQTYGEESGALSKSWHSLGTATDPEVCVGGETVDMRAAFSNGRLHPTAHPACRCSIILNYPDGG